MSISVLQGLGSARCVVSGLESLSIVPIDFWHRHYVATGSFISKHSIVDFFVIF